MAALMSRCNKTEFNFSFPLATSESPYDSAVWFEGDVGLLKKDFAYQASLIPIFGTFRIVFLLQKKLLGTTLFQALYTHDLIFN